MQLHGTSAPDLPEAAVAKLSTEDALLLRTQLAVGKTPLDQTSVADLEQQQDRWRWMGSDYGPVEPNTKPYLYRQRLALELRFRAHVRLERQVAALQTQQVT